MMPILRHTGRVSKQTWKGSITTGGLLALKSVVAWKVKSHQSGLETPQ